ncbi:GDSL esterase/lipase 5 [Linum perenne]
MNKPNNFFLRLHQLAALAFIISAICRAEAKKQRPGFFLFGDSFLDAGNNNYINTTTLDQANFWPYGTTFFHSPTGRFSDGRLLPDFIAKYAKLPLIPPFLRPGNKVNDLVAGVNFASGGAGALVDTFRGDVIDLKTQLGNMKKVNQLLRNKLGKEEAKAIVSSAVYMFSIGSNDYMSPFLTNSSSSSQTSSSILVSMVISNLTAVVKEIYEMGGRKFVFMNVPTLGCLPAMRLLMNRGSSCSDDRVSELAKLHNAALSMVLPQMGREMKGFKYSLFDFSRSLHRRMTRPSNYGLKEGEEACCGTGKWRGVYSCGGKRTVKEFEVCKRPYEYVFWDSFHLTEKVYHQMAAEIWNPPFSSSTTTNSPLTIGPYTLHQLFHD